MNTATEGITQITATEFVIEDRQMPFATSAVSINQPQFDKSA